ncbi:MAG: hypothetical protein A2268_14045 [Candidatus Raymondbacteria bacterium RifOxyA12_full_50_37]|uniref:Uncharacterized protein n=1 Tax=Candidatus Raymondbacteria bacterium RIFOXYD12_FULL_49_13 TaxID=1817890 RepID=A0A1F7FL83_UNCRA|nr:MAG: hypothetical protein A2268_14045 [Candidatus Raymondbacteria bacterium RifOxyA12_full_50_37]OGJ88200.1 MAG: hypothetical protein A2248_19385 [Candidatus Raymondbacteria bacterium RIFOXYA2_FULL_49_16]OGJ93973.1 MAG: hypothetical protein A2487_08810 [Candidatus Raymondbacteria bacterium RifOxyC12_full_50_8]OGJ94987.1 MAG: hypothetical protein A2350_09605 [Candidatus Raymondbacteria bacterium RifOxyB12_full_50_8]OGK07246.1 MAG: hypothetical protein A2519_14050 [Candidatus Raymondbacteria b
MVRLLLICFYIAACGADLPYLKKRTYTYSIYVAGEQCGFSRFRIADTVAAKRTALAVTETVYVKNASMEVSSRTTVVYSLSGAPLYYSGKSRFTVAADSAMNGFYQVSIAFIDSGANVEVLKDGKPFRKMGVPLQHGPFHVIEGNHLGQFALAVFFTNDLLVSSVERQVFHVGSYKTISLELRMVRYAELKTNTRLVPCRRVDYFLGGKEAGTLWISEAGMLLRDEERNGGVVIDLED